jgi:NAD+ kinase
MRPQRIGLIANSTKAGAPALARALRSEFERHRVALEYEWATAAMLGLESTVGVRELARNCDLLVVLGGDGTILQTLGEIEGPPPPMLGINLGTMGFLTCLGAAAYLEAVEIIVQGSYRLSERSLLDVHVVRDGQTLFSSRALNDAIISRGKLSRLIRLDVRIDGASLTEYNADGLIVSTPTGSTAYSLSAGGPVLTPDSGTFVITPICPHVLTNRSIIVGDRSRIEIAPAREADAVYLTMDGGKVIPVNPPESICITKAEHSLPLAMPPGVSFFEVLRQKLKWSGTAV